MKFRILLLDDERFRSVGIKEKLRARWPQHEFDFIEAISERDFERKLEMADPHGWDLVVADQMLPYADRQDGDRTFPEARNLDRFRAGGRCIEKLKSNDDTKHVPVIIYSILERGAIPPDAIYLPKTGDPALSDLIDAIEKTIIAKKK